MLIAKFICPVALLILLTSCRNDDETSATLGLYKKGSGWPSGTVAVCFSKGGVGTRDLFNYLKVTVESEINSTTKFLFTGFRSCSELPGAKVEVRFERGTSTQGEAGVGRVDAPITDFLTHFTPDFRIRNRVMLQAEGYDSRQKKWSPLDKKILHGIILHEFGHVMGLYHEYDRSDFRPSVYCDNALLNNRNSSISQSVRVGRYDERSVMNNLCRRQYGLDYISLSKGDVATINTLYPSGPGNNGGYRLRCTSQQELIQCLQNTERNQGMASCKKRHAGNAEALSVCLRQCIEERCWAGSYICEKPDALLACAASQGGVSCLSEKHGRCQKAGFQ